MERLNEIRQMLGTIRSIISEENNDSEEQKGAIAITDDPKFGENVLTNQIEQFKSSVDGGAEFSSANSENPENSPLIYFSDNGNLMFSGTIRDITWQFVLKDRSGNGCYIWTNKTQLNDENMAVINKLHGYYKNWCDEWNREGASLSKLNSFQ